MRLNYAEWSDIELLNLFQVLMTAKFDSGRSEILIGQPMVTSLMRELSEHSFADESISKIISASLSQPMASHIRDLVLEAARATCDNLGLGNVTLEDLRGMSFPFQFTEADYAELIGLL